MLDPAEPLWITDIALLGVDCWQREGTPHRSWDRVPLDGRDVFVCFDSDVMTKPGVAPVLDRLDGFLSSRRARVPRLTDGIRPGHRPLPASVVLALQSWLPLDTAAGGRLLVQYVERLVARVVSSTHRASSSRAKKTTAPPTSAAFYRQTLLPLMRLGVAVVIMDHAGNDPSKPRGSSGKRDDVDTVWRLTRRTRDQLTAKRTHSRKRHEVDTLILHLVGEPLQHKAETPDERAEQMIDRCLAAICGLEPMPAAEESGNKIQERLKTTVTSDGPDQRDRRETTREVGVG